MAQILVVRGGALGDTILTLPLLESIRRLEPERGIFFVGSRAYKSLVPPDVSFQALDGPEWLWLFSETISPLPGIGDSFQEAYVVLNRPDIVVSNLLKAGVKVVRHTTAKPPSDRHVVESMHRGLGLPIPSRAPILSHLTPEGMQDLIWLHPGSGSPGKCMPLDFMASVAETLKASTGWDVAVTAGEEDAFLTRLPSWNRLTGAADTRLYVNKSLTEICRELGAARLFVGNDSGISHLAAGLGIPSVVFFVFTDPAQWSPWAPENSLKVVDVRALDREAAGFARECLGMIERFISGLPAAAGSM